MNNLLRIYYKCQLPLTLPYIDFYDDRLHDKE